MSIQDLSQLPAPDLLESLDYETIFAQMRDKLLANDPTFTAMTESDPVYKLLEVAAYFRLLDRQRVNEAAQAVLLAYAQNNDLDQVGVRFNVARQQIAPANDTTFPPTPAVMEPDDDYRRRIQLALEGMSVAGPVNAYKFHALSAHPLVADVTAISKTPGHVLVSVLSRQGNGHAEQPILDAVTAALSAEDTRPLTDALAVQSATIINYDIEATLYLDSGPEYEPVLAEAQARIQAYTTEQFRLGRNIRKSAIDAALHVAGVQNVVIHKPLNDVVISKEQAGYCAAISVNYGGEDE
ncbi:baseplate assembly protein [Vibrio ostreicida]|uniref:Baseplate J/gp47 family protein n=1 Tax=Vibrio ostreicida TaxID=526588 RepID=A0ABT8BXF0_9VIBR|nr:baseplate J/gp47 family protein [Vibrio ostreicida]MDN3611349.1 baseplate J/gp47 family protein [Vibrio ostreicida]NPD09285.1 baseplate assembly protein [Vibrio ostreicida]